MANWQAIVGSTTYELSDRNPFDVVSITGVGIAPARRLTQRGPLQHGETDIGFRLDPRNINLVIAAKGVDRAAADTARQTLAYIFGPRQSEPVKLRCTRDDGQVRQIDCRTVGLLDTPVTDSERIDSFQRVGVQLVASDPNWYDPGVVIAPTIALLTGLWTIPFEVPFELAAGTVIDSQMQATYTGTFDEYPIITLVGPLTDPVITNVTTGDVLDFTGTTIAGGDSYIVDLRYGYKTVTEDDGTNRIAKLTADSDLATWRLASILETGDGVNVIGCEATSTTAASSFTMSYTNRYVSL